MYSGAGSRTQEPRAPPKLNHAAAAAYSDRDTGRFSVRRYEAEGASFLPVAGERLVVALHGWLVASDTGDGRHVPFLQPTLGGHNALRAYADYRFRNVAARIADLNLDKGSYGAGLRLHSRSYTFARLDVAHGGEGWRVPAPPEAPT